MKIEQELREIFLEEFTLALILALKKHKGISGIHHKNIIRRKIPIKPVQFEPIIIKPLVIIPKPVPIIAPQPFTSIQQELPQTLPVSHIVPIVPARPAPIFIPPARPILLPARPIAPAKPAAPIKLEEPIPSISIGPINPETLKSLGLGKLTILLLDPSVISVECPGPAKPVLVNRFDTMQTTNIILTADEINGIMKILSERTRIPLITGVFKVAFGNFITTAVVSEFVGTRFVIQKRKLPNQIIIRKI